MSMRERIERGKLFTDDCEGLPEDRKRCKKYMKEFNDSSMEDIETRMTAQAKLFGHETKAWIEPPFYCCYGTNIFFKGMCYINFNCNFVDDGKIIIGDKVLFGVAVTIATVGHPINPKMRGYMYTAPVVIEDNCWIGSNVTICPDVTIGKNSVIGAGSVVIKDIPANSVAVGNPCRVLREINEHDMNFYFRNFPFDEKDLEEERTLRG